MNLPNKLTMLRILMIPLFVVIFYIPYLQDNTLSIFNLNIHYSNIVAALVFGIAAYTDRLDGAIARKHNLVTTFGKFMDPLADKLLVMAALLIAIEINLLAGVIPIIILAREFIVTGIRTLAISEGKVIAASNLGKAKTVFQIIMIIALLVCDIRGHVLFSEFAFFSIIVDITVVLATLLTIISGYDYFVKNKHIIFSSK